MSDDLPKTAAYNEATETLCAQDWWFRRKADAMRDELLPFKSMYEEARQDANRWAIEKKNAEAEVKRLRTYCDRRHNEAFRAECALEDLRTAHATFVTQYENEMKRLRRIALGEAPDPDGPEWDDWARVPIGRCVDHAMELTHGSWHMHPYCKREKY
jgi:hypothetical protein